MLHSHALGSQPSSQSTSEFSLGSPQVATAIANSVQPIQPILPNIAGIDSLAHLCLASFISLDHSVFSSNLVPPSNLKSTEWIIDSGAADHMVHSISLLIKITSVAHVFVSLPNEESILVTHVGQVQLSYDLVLDNVLCVPSFSFNLISIGKLTHHLMLLHFLVAFLFSSGPTSMEDDWIE